MYKKADEPCNESLWRRVPLRYGFLKTSLTKDYTSNCGFHLPIKRASVSVIHNSKLMIVDIEHTIGRQSAAGRHLANDHERSIKVLSHETENKKDVHLQALTAKHYAMRCYEREIAENFGIIFTHHPEISTEY